MGVTAVAKIGDFVIPNGAAVSNIIAAREGYEDAENIIAESIDMGDVATFTLETTSDADPLAATGVTWRTFQILNGATLADFVIPNNATKSYLLPWGVASATGLRIKASGNVTAIRTLRLSKLFGN